MSRRICDWCGKHLGDIEPLSDTGLVRGGICQSCADKSWNIHVEPYLSKNLGPVGKFTDKELESACFALDIDCSKYPGLLEGMNVELEHVDVTGGNPSLSAKIALSHLREKPDYYIRLKKAGL